MASQQDADRTITTINEADIKKILDHLGLHPPDGTIRVTATAEGHVAAAWEHLGQRTSVGLSLTIPAPKVIGLGSTAMDR